MGALEQNLEGFLDNNTPGGYIQTNVSISNNQIEEYISEQINNKGFITNAQEIDPTVPAWAKAANKPTYSVNEITGALSKNDITITNTLSNGTLLATINITGKDPIEIRGASNNSGGNSEESQNIPINISELNNDAHFISEDVLEISLLNNRTKVFSLDTPINEGGYGITFPSNMDFDINNIDYNNTVSYSNLTLFEDIMDAITENYNVRLKYKNSYFTILSVQNNTTDHIHSLFCCTTIVNRNIEYRLVPYMQFLTIIYEDSNNESNTTIMLSGQTELLTYLLDRNTIFELLDSFIDISYLTQNHYITQTELDTAINNLRNELGG